MITLHENAVVAEFTRQCMNIWKQWLRIPNPKPANRKVAFANAHNQLLRDIHFAPIRITFAPIDSEGAFTWGEWEIEVKESCFDRDGILCKDYVELCKTIYHETRHAEQFYREAQALSLGRLEFPGKTVQSVLQIKNALGIPLNVAFHATTNRDTYVTFAKTPKLGHCSLGSGPGWDNWDPTVDDWLQRTYDKVKGNFAQMGQNAERTNVRGRRNVLDTVFYGGAEDEVDAVAMEKLLQAALSTLMPAYEANRAKARTDPVFGQ
jgi:hypothetical protein